jgi:anaerobic magnesium-protoporphyrin IX monomethyl ester cyclase
VASSRKKIVLYSPQLADETRGYPSGKEVLPMPMLAIAAWPLADGYDVVIVDGSLYAQEEAHRRVLEHCEGALLYGTTGILGWQVSDGYACSTKVRARFPRLPMFVGGWFASVAPELQLDTGLYDAVALGQGEITFREIVAAVDSGEPLESVPGLALRRDGRTVLTPHRAVVGWDALLNFPWHLVDFDVYREEQLRQRGGRVLERFPRGPGEPRSTRHVSISYFASFGCPEPCTFCCSPGVTDQRWKAMPAARMLDDLEELQERWDMDGVRFFDANFGVSERRVREFAEGKIARKLRFRYFPFLQAFSVLRYRPETLDLLPESGLSVANIGAETGDEGFMQRIGKHTHGDDNFEAALALDRRGIITWMTYLIGCPGESEAAMLATLDQARRILAACTHSHPTVWPYKPIPGTPMYEEALREGFVPPRTLPEWGDFGEYHLDPDPGWAARIPRRVALRRRLYQHFASLAHGTARDRIGWWERRARGRLRRGDYRFARIEAKAFDLWRRFGIGRDAPETWETGDGSHRLLAGKSG